MGNKRKKGKRKKNDVVVGEGAVALDRFNGKAEGTLAYYTALWLTLRQGGAQRMEREAPGSTAKNIKIIEITSYRSP